MFRRSSPWGGWAYGGHPTYDDDYVLSPFGAFPYHGVPVRSSAPFEDLFFQLPGTYAHPAYPVARPSLSRGSPAFVPSSGRVPRGGNPFFVAPGPASHFFCHPQAEDDDEDEDAIELSPWGRPIRRPAPSRQAPQQQVPVSARTARACSPEVANSWSRKAGARGAAAEDDGEEPASSARAAAAAAKKAPVHETRGRRDPWFSAYVSDSGDDQRSTEGHSAAEPPSPPQVKPSLRQQPQQQQTPARPVWLFDPTTGHCYLAAAPAAALADGGSKRRQQPQQEHQPTAKASAQASTSSAAPRKGAAAAAAPSGPTRIQVRAGGGPATATAGGDALERQGSTAIVPRGAMEVALSRGPSANLPSATDVAATAAAATTTAAGKAAAVPTRTTIPVRQGPSAPSAASAVPVTSSKPAAAAAAKTPVRAMTKSQAARTIQRWWRGWRLWRHADDLRALVAVAAELRAAATKFYGYMGATEANITDRQHLEVNELTMKVILKLDSMQGLPAEFRALRKHLTARALKLQDEVQAAYNSSLARPAIVRAASSNAPKALAPAPAVARSDSQAAPAAPPPSLQTSASEAEATAPAALGASSSAADGNAVKEGAAADAAAATAGEEVSPEGAAAESATPSASTADAEAAAASSMASEGVPESAASGGRRGSSSAGGKRNPGLHLASRRTRQALRRLGLLCASPRFQRATLHSLAAEGARTSGEQNASGTGAGGEEGDGVGKPGALQPQSAPSVTLRVVMRPDGESGRGGSSVLTDAGTQTP